MQQEAQQTCRAWICPPRKVSYFTLSNDAGRTFLPAQQHPWGGSGHSGSSHTGVCRLQLLDEDEAIFERYRALFGLRNQGTPEAVAALGESFSGSSALLKHEVAYVLGQMLQNLAIPFLRCRSFFLSDLLRV